MLEKILEALGEIRDELKKLNKTAGTKKGAKEEPAVQTPPPAVQPPPPPAAPAPAAPAEEKKPASDGKVDPKELEKAFLAFLKANGREKAVAVLGKYGAPKASEVPADKVAAFYADLTAKAEGSDLV